MDVNYGTSLQFHLVLVRKKLSTKYPPDTLSRQQHCESFCSTTCFESPRIDSWPTPAFTIWRLFWRIAGFSTDTRLTISDNHHLILPIEGRCLHQSVAGPTGLDPSAKRARLPPQINQGMTK